MKTPVVSARLRFKQPAKNNPKTQDKLQTQPGKTQAELAFLEAQRKRQTERIGSHLQVTHKERIEQYNKLLGSLPEHFDLPKSSSG